MTAVLSRAIPDRETALRELARVLAPGGRLVVGELFGDPHWVSPKRLHERAERAGLKFGLRSAPRWATSPVLSADSPTRRQHSAKRIPLPQRGERVEGFTADVPPRRRPQLEVKVASGCASGLADLANALTGEHSVACP